MVEREPHAVDTIYIYRSYIYIDYIYTYIYIIYIYIYIYIYIDYIYLYIHIHICIYEYVVLTCVIPNYVFHRFVGSCLSHPEFLHVIVFGKTLPEWLHCRC